MDPNGLIIEADDALTSIHTRSVIRGLKRADAYGSPAVATSDELRQAVRTAADRARAAEPLRCVKRVDDVVRFLLEHHGFDVAWLTRKAPPPGLTICHVAHPGAEWLTWVLPDGTDNVGAICFELLGVVARHHEMVERRTPPPEATEEFEAGQFGYQHCDWCHQDVSATHSVWDMRVLLMSQGNRLFAWICCADCSTRLEGSHPGGLRWMPQPPAPRRAVLGVPGRLTRPLRAVHPCRR
ncbi:hypothetical protein LX14_000356 [Williamsia deligens]|nr:hypothetical protein [Williamsia deligens]